VRRENRCINEEPLPPAYREKNVVQERSWRSRPSKPDVPGTENGKVHGVRPRKCRLVYASPTARFFKPRGTPLCELEVVCLKDEEYEALRLSDYRKLDQEEAAKLMGISRPTFSRVLACARQAVARALVEGCALEIKGGDFERVKTAPVKKGKK
jgi:predicted DNA-binding protein (UPF0251 family)